MKSLDTILQLEWKKEEEWVEKWYNTELIFRSFNKERNPLVRLIIRHDLNVMALNNDWYYHEYFVDEWGKDKTNASQNLPLLKKLLRFEQDLVEKVERIINIVKNTKKIDKKIFRQIEQGLSNLQYIFIIDLGAYVQPILDKRLREKGIEGEQMQMIKDYFFLKKNTFLYQKEEKNLVLLARIYRKRYGSKDVLYEFLTQPMKQLLLQHWEKYRCLTAGELDTEPASVEDYFDRLKKIPLAKKRTSSFKKRIAFLKLLNKKDLECFKIVSELSYMDNYVGDLYRTLDLILNDFIHMQYEIPYKEITWYSFTELKSLIYSGIRIQRKLLEQRKRYRGIVNIAGDTETFYEKKYFNKIKRYVDKQNVGEIVSTFSGLVASQGKAVGIVKIIKSQKDLYKVEQGDILVAFHTEPDYTQAMKKSSAIVTNYGGITSHAAIISREFQIPCIVGTHIATQVLHDGDTIEVDAVVGKVTLLKKVNV